MIKEENEVIVIDLGMGMYKIENFDPLASIKYMGHLKIVSELGCARHVEGNIGYGCHEIDK